MLRRPTIAIGLASGLVSYLVLFGVLFVVPYYLSAQRVDFALIGLQLSLLPLGIGIAAPIAGRLLGRIGERALTSGGLIVTAAGLLETVIWNDTPGLLIGLALAGLGLGAFTPANNATIMKAAPAGHAGVISGVLNMSRGMGTALGIALASALYTAAARTAGAHATPVAAVHGLTVALAVLSSIALAVGLALLTNRAEADRAALSLAPGDVPTRAADPPVSDSSARQSAAQDRPVWSKAAG